MIINTNYSAVNGNRFLAKAQLAQQKWMEQLSSGKRINKAGDDAAGTAVAARFDKLIRGNKTGIRNANDGVSMVQTFEGAAASVEAILQRMRELAVQSKNGTYDVTDRTNLDTEFGELQTQAANIINNTTFNSQTLFAAVAGTVVLQVGSAATETMTLNTINLNAIATYAGDITSATNANTAIGAIDGFLDTVNTGRANLGAYQNRLEYTVDNLNTNITNTTGARSRIIDADMAEASSELAKYRVLSQSSVAMIAQANSLPQMVQQLLQ